MVHPFGDLLRQYRARKANLSLTRLAHLAGNDQAVLTRMAQGGKDLTGPSGRERVVRVLTVLRDEGALAARLMELATTAHAQSLAGVPAGITAEPYTTEPTEPTPHNLSAHYERTLTAARARLGDPMLAAAFTEGRAMTWDQAAAYALDEGED